MIRRQLLLFTVRRRPISYLSARHVPIPKPCSSPSPVFLNPKSHFSNRPNGFDVKKESSQSQSPEPINHKPLPESDVESPIEATNTTSSKKKTPSEGKLEELKGKIGALKMKPKDFDPSKMACWETGEKIPFIFFCLAFDLISANRTDKIVITDIVCNMLRTVMETTPDDLLPVVYLLTNKIAPAHEEIKLRIRESVFTKALAEAYSKTESDVDLIYEEIFGDSELVTAKASRGTQSTMSQPEQLTVSKVFDTFRLIAKQSGKDGQDSETEQLIKGLLVAAIDSEPQYILWFLQSLFPMLPFGVGDQTLLAALGQASVYIEKHSKPPSHVKSPLEEAEQILKGVYSVLPVYDRIVPVLLNNGVWNLSKMCNPVPGVPVAPMRAKRAYSVSELVDKFQDIEFTCEYKYNGERAQIHYTEDGSVEIYGRHAMRITREFPDVVATISRLKKSSVQSFILDCELVAYDREKKKILPSSILSPRLHRKNVVVSDIKTDVCIFAFDILYLNGEPLIQEQLEVRREGLYSSFDVEAGFFQYTTALKSNDVEEIGFCLDDVDSSCAGLIIKTLNKDATYEPSKRSGNWLRVMKDSMEPACSKSFDLVPIGAFHGTGKRFYDAFLLACYDNNKEEYQTICKLPCSRFSDAQLEEHFTRLRSKVITEPKSYFRFGEKLNPDVWFEPSEVWEVKGRVCPVPGAVDPNEGISLRFARMLRVRGGTAPKDASSPQQVAEADMLRKAQTLVDLPIDFGSIRVADNSRRLCQPRGWLQLSSTMPAMRSLNERLKVRFGKSMLISDHTNSEDELIYG